MIELSLLRSLNAGTKAERLAALARATARAKFPPVDPRMVNNHIHTSYSFSPYSPAAAVYAARAEGLATCGIVDHDSIGGAEEFLEAGKIVGIPTTIGIETRVSFAETAFCDRRTNNPDQIGNSYMVLHAVPHANIEPVQAYFAPLREKRNARNQKMVARINERYAADGVSLDFERDVLPLSQFADGGSVTERHLMLALARQLLKLGKANPVETLKSISGGDGYDDVICFAPVKPVVEQSDGILAVDGCLNFFAGPGDTAFSATMNFYNVHYNRTHVAATSHGNTDDMREAIAMMNAGLLNPAAMITHIGGLDCVVETTANLPKIPGGKKLIYTQINLPLTAIADFAEKGKTEPMFAKLDEIVKSHNGLWNAEAEKYLLGSMDS